MDLLDVGTADSKVASHVILAKLPNIFRGGLVHIVGSIYPSFNDLLENFNIIVVTLSRTGYK